MNHHTANLKHYLLKNTSPVIRLLVISDAIFAGASGLLGPIFALFIEDYIYGGSPAIAGTAAGIYLLTKSILQIPVAHFIDHIHGEKDDFWLMFIFTLLAILSPLLYIVINTPFELYLVEFILGCAAAFTFPTFMAIFTRHVDQNKEGTEWGVYFTITDLTGAVAATVGGYIATSHGFPLLILITVFLSLIGTLPLLLVKPH